MDTRTEIINGYTYCAYCGKELSNPHYLISPRPSNICDCEKAKEKTVSIFNEEWCIGYVFQKYLWQEECGE